MSTTDATEHADPDRGHVLTSDEAAVSVARAQTALAEIAARRAADEQREAAEQARRDELAHWAAEQDPAERDPAQRDAVDEEADDARLVTLATGPRAGARAASAAGRPASRSRRRRASAACQIGDDGLGRVTYSGPPTSSPASSRSGSSTGGSGRTPSSHASVRHAPYAQSTSSTTAGRGLTPSRAQSWPVGAAASAATHSATHDSARACSHVATSAPVRHRRSTTTHDPLDRRQPAAGLDVADRLDEPVRQVVQLDDLPVLRSDPCRNDRMIGRTGHKPQCASGPDISGGRGLPGSQRLEKARLHKPAVNPASRASDARNGVAHDHRQASGGTATSSINRDRTRTARTDSYDLRVQIFPTCSRRRPPGAARPCARCSRRRSLGACGLPAGPRTARDCRRATPVVR